MTQTETDRLIRALTRGDAAGTASIVDQARTSDEPILLVAGALIDHTARGLLERATELAANTRDRQLVAIAAAHLAGDKDRVDGFARDHLADYPDSILVAWIAATSRPATSNPARAPQTPTVEPQQLTRPHHHEKEKS